MANTSSETSNYVLGIDLGSASLGWALIGLDHHGSPAKILKLGVRIFEAAVSGDFEKGQDESNAVARRGARLIRRQLRRRAARQAELFRLLQKNSLLPANTGVEADASTVRHSILNELDHQISIKWIHDKDTKSFVELPLYKLRKAGLYQQLEAFELGRVFYHLSQRRGFRSNRTADGEGKKGEDQGAVKTGISELAEAIRAAGAQTIGEYFASLDPHTQKVRRIWTGRSMYEEEFGKIWAIQSSFHPTLLTEELYREIKRLLFYQRPIKAQTSLIGECELEPGERRASWATLEAQRFRLLQKVNDLEIVYPGNVNGVALSQAQKQQVYKLLDSQGDQTFKSIREHLGLDKNIGFNLQRGGEKTIKGNNVQKRMIEAFGARWQVLTEEDKRLVVEEWRTIDSPESLQRRLISKWKLTPEAAQRLALSTPPSGYCMLSRKAIRRILPIMLDGKRFMAARQEIPEYIPKQETPLNRIPPVRDALRNLRNPAVERALTEVRKVVNALVGEYGKPSEVRIELARDLKKPRQERIKATDSNRKRQRERDAVKQRILRECGLDRPSRDDVEKALLWEECGGICPYTGRSISFASMYGEHPQFDVEHIIPFSRLPDNSFQNKTLCYHEENRNVKRNRTPFEAYPDAEDYDAVLTRVRAWKVPNIGKQKRFELRTLEELEGFSTRQLNDTRYSSLLACDLIAKLYGGRVVDTGSGTRQVVFASSGMVTATLRKGLGLEALLREAVGSSNGENRGKPRTDHRHHAIDALTIALTQQSMIQTMSRTASLEPNWASSSRSLRSIPSPWVNFIDSVRPHVQELLVSHRPEHRLTGALHDETNYGKPHNVNGKNLVHIRKPVSGLSKGDIDNIVDPAIREAVRRKAAEFAGDLKRCNPKEGIEDWPQLLTKTGKTVPIKRVRISKSLEVETIAKGNRTRYVATSSNHHVAIFAQLDDQGREKRWEPMIVSLYEAMDRKRKGLPVVRKSHPEAQDYIFKFSLMGGDTVLLHKDCDHDKDICTASVWRLRTIASNGQLSLVRINDARLKVDIQKAKEWWSPATDSLRKLGGAKVVIDSLGRLHGAND